MKILLFLAAVVGVAFSTFLDDEWRTWKTQHGRTYEDEATESVRRLIWEDNRRFVEQENSKGHSYELKLNDFGDLVSPSSYIAN